jgi:hypothetical protein
VPLHRSTLVWEFAVHLPSLAGLHGDATILWVFRSARLSGYLFVAGAANHDGHG